MRVHARHGAEVDDGGGVALLDDGRARDLAADAQVLAPVHFGVVPGAVGVDAAAARPRLDAGGALRVTVIGVRPRLNIGGWLAQRASGIHAPPGRRRVYADGNWHEAEVHRREHLGAGSVITGPAIVEQRDTTTVVDLGTVARVDAHGNLIMEASRS